MGDIILDAIGRLFFYVEALAAQFLDLLYEVFEIYAGIKPVTLRGSQSFLLDVFFGDEIITTLYWGMAVIGIAMTFGFAIFSIIKKMFDSTGEKVKATNGQILTNVFKAILLIILMTAIVSATITATGTLMQQVDYLFNNAEEINNPGTIYFDEEDYATMFRVIDTIGSYSLNSSFNNRVNINSCFNAIRGDLYVLSRNRVFEYDYDETAEAKRSWQYALRQIYLSADVTEDLPLDIYNEAVTNAIVNVVDRIRTDSSFVPLSSYYRGYTLSAEGSVLGRTVLLSSTFKAAKNSKYNKNPGIRDSIRAPFYIGEKDIYDLDEVEQYFDVGFDTWDHMATLMILAMMILEFLKLLINCVARMFNIILLYITAPGFISVMPLDDGGKFKQWCTSFVIQSLSIFGTVFAVRLLMVFMPIVLNSELVIFQDTLKDIMAKLVIIVGICFTSEKASGMISGILADNAGYQSIMAGDVGSGAVSKGLSFAGGVAKGILKTGAKAGGAVLSGLATATGLSTVGKSIGDRAKHFGQVMRDRGGLPGLLKNGDYRTDEEKKQDEKSQQEEADRQDTRDFRNNVSSALGALSEKLSPPPAQNPVGGSKGGSGGGSSRGSSPAPGGQQNMSAPTGNNTQQSAPQAPPQVPDSMGPGGQQNMSEPASNEADDDE